MLEHIVKLKHYLFPSTKNSELGEASIFRRRGLWDDHDFLDSFAKGNQIEGEVIFGRDERFWQMLQFYKKCQSLEGETAEAGALFGLSSYLMCHEELRSNPGFDGSSHHVYDSFLGLSKPSTEDLAGEGAGNQIMKEVAIGSDSKYPFLEKTQKTLHEFPGIHFNKGWIPDVFEGQATRQYRFVHIDLDMYEPTYLALNFFYLQLVKGGCIVIDDYGFVNWPGAKTATDQWAAENGAQVLPLFTGNAVIFKE